MATIEEIQRAQQILGGGIQTPSTSRVTQPTPVLASSAQSNLGSLRFATDPKTGLLRPTTVPLPPIFGPQQPEPKEPVIISNLGVQRRGETSKATLMSAEAALRESESVLQRARTFREEQAGKQGIQPQQEAPQLRNITGSPATGTAIEDINRAIVRGGITEDEQTAFNEAKAKERDATLRLAAARDAADRGDTGRLNEMIGLYNQDRTDYLKQIETLRTKLEPLITRRVELGVRGAEEKAVQTQLADLRSQADKFKLETQRQKLAQFEGQTLGFAAGRAGRIEFERSFKIQEMALEEKNLLTRLGLAQEARELEGKTVQEQIVFLRTDFELSLIHI